MASIKQINEFFQYYFAMCSHTRIPANRGFTPDEMREKLGDSPCSIEFGPNISRALQTGQMDMGELRAGITDSDIPAPWKAGMLKDLQWVAQKKPGRNDPCPCGSGKKYKKCCGRNK